MNNGKLFLGIELGSTRIKAVLTDGTHRPAAVGAFDWENSFENGYWTYSLDSVWDGIRTAYRRMAEEYERARGEKLRHIDAMGVSAMMHGYLPFDASGELLTPFRTWRNTTTAQAAEELTARFGFNIPQRWSIAHLYQAMLNGEEHVRDISYLTTLAGYVHWRLTGEKLLGIGDAAGMFPIAASGGYDGKMLADFDDILKEAEMPFRLETILPAIRRAGDSAGALTEEGAALIDPSGMLAAGVPLCPPEGDAGTGMTATNAVAAGTGNVSAGTSIFAMIVLEKPLKGVYPEIDVVATPDGKPAAMVHCNTGTSDMDAWVRLLGEMAEAAGARLTKNELYTLIYKKALEGEPDCGGMVSFNYYAGEPVTGVEDGRPMFLRRPSSDMSLANFARCHLYSAMAALKLGLDILAGENVRASRLVGHGGMFKAAGAAQRLMAGALRTPVTVMETAGEGGPWGMALLAEYMSERDPGQTLEDYLERAVFAGNAGTTAQPDMRTAEGFDRFIEDYRRCIPLEKAAASALM